MSNSKNNIKNGSCPVYKKCGGCQLQNLSYQKQLEFKHNKVEKLLKHFAKVEPIIGMENPYHYRNKVQAAFYTDRRGKIISGVYQSGTPPVFLHAPFYHGAGKPQRQTVWWAVRTL